MQPLCTARRPLLPVHQPSRNMLLVQIMKKLVAAGNDARIGAIIAKLAEVDGPAHWQNARCVQHHAVQHAVWRSSHTATLGRAVCRTTR